MKRPKTFSLRGNALPQEAYLVNADGRILGRLAVRIAQILMGKHRSIFTPHVNGRDVVIVVNASKIRLSGRKEEQKSYFFHSGYPGGDKHIPLWKLRPKYPDRILQFAVSGMLPKNRLRDRRLSRLKIFAGADHPFTHWDLKEVSV